MAFLELDHVSVVFPAVQGMLSSRKPASVVAVDGVSLSVEREKSWDWWESRAAASPRCPAR